ncbi:hypothetical protein [Streptomyces murinus]|uniref:hypothetical protein n=1 Tax=Streptomyces murinus TaxID=33900 RepID=UPI003812809F
MSARETIENLWARAVPVAPLLDAVRAERDAEILYWLGKKALEYRATGKKADAERADVIGLMASKISRGAVRSNNRRLPAGVAPGFFQPGHTYTHVDDGTDWRFRCDTVTTHPEDGELTALGWRFFKGVWTECAYGLDDWEIHLNAGITEAGEVR